MNRKKTLQEHFTYHLVTFMLSALFRIIVFRNLFKMRNRKSTMIFI